MAEEHIEPAVTAALLGMYQALGESALEGAERRMVAMGFLLMERLAGGLPAGWRRTAREDELAREVIEHIRELKWADARMAPAWDALEDALLRARRTQSGRVLDACTYQLAELPRIEPVPLDGVGRAAERFLEKVAEDDPRLAVLPGEVAALMARLADVRPGHRVLDPCCGTGGLLVEAARSAAASSGGAAPGVGLFGQEAHAYAHVAARFNLRLHGLDDADLVHGDALQAPAFVDEGGRRLAAFDRVITAPPLSARWTPPHWDPFGRFEPETPAAHAADFAYLQHAAASLRPGGRAVVLMPPGVLFRGGREGKIRADMVSSGLIEAVIALPRKLLFGTRTGTVLVVLHRREASTDGTVRFVDASSWLDEGGRGRNRLRPQDVHRVMRLYADPAHEPESAAVVELDRLRGANYDLNIAKWVVAREAGAELDLRRELLDVRAVERARDEAASALDTLLARLLDPEGDG